MDIATIIGIFAGVILVMSSILQGGNFVMFINIPSIMIVVGGIMTQRRWQDDQADAT